LARLLGRGVIPGLRRQTAAVGRRHLKIRFVVLAVSLHFSSSRGAWSAGWPWIKRRNPQRP
jgi:hypothetical protein